MGKGWVGRKWWAAESREKPKSAVVAKAARRDPEPHKRLDQQFGGVLGQRITRGFAQHGAAGFARDPLNSLLALAPSQSEVERFQ